MKTCWQAPVFSAETWYSNPADHRCPQDASLESVDIAEPAQDVRGKRPRPHPEITLKLFSAYQDGWIVLSYFGVRDHSLCAYLCDQGIGEWLRDEFTENEAKLTTHRITWRSADGRVSRWVIDAEEICCEWHPKFPLPRASPGGKATPDP